MSSEESSTFTHIYGVPHGRLILEGSPEILAGNIEGRLRINLYGKGWKWEQVGIWEASCHKNRSWFSRRKFLCWKMQRKKRQEIKFQLEKFYFHFRTLIGKCCNQKRDLFSRYAADNSSIWNNWNWKQTVWCPVTAKTLQKKTKKNIFLWQGRLSMLQLQPTSAHSTTTHTAL